MYMWFIVKFDENGVLLLAGWLMGLCARPTSKEKKNYPANLHNKAIAKYTGQYQSRKTADRLDNLKIYWVMTK